MASGLCSQSNDTCIFPFSPVAPMWKGEGQKIHCLGAMNFTTLRVQSSARNIKKLFMLIYRAKFQKTARLLVAMANLKAVSSCSIVTLEKKRSCIYLENISSIIVSEIYIVCAFINLYFSSNFLVILLLKDRIVILFNGINK